MARPSLQNNVKFKALVRRLELPKPYVRGLLDTMWDVANECGNPVLGSPEDVEAAAEWPGAPGAFFESVYDDWLDQRPDGTWEIHDYWDHAPHYVKNRKAMEERRKRTQRHAPKNTRQNDWNGDNREINDLRSESVTQFYTGVEKCTTPAPFNTSPNGEGPAIADPPPKANRSTRPTADAPKEGKADPSTGPARTRRQPTGPHAELISHFLAAWKARYGVDFAFGKGKDGGKNGTHIAWVLNECGQDLNKAKATVDAYLRDDSPKLVTARHPLGWLVSSFNQFRPAPPVQREPATVQRFDI